MLAGIACNILLLTLFEMIVSSICRGEVSVGMLALVLAFLSVFCYQRRQTVCVGVLLLINIFSFSSRKVEVELVILIKD